MDNCTGAVALAGRAAIGALLRLGGPAVPHMAAQELALPGPRPGPKWSGGFEPGCRPGLSSPSLPLPRPQALALNRASRERLSPGASPHFHAFRLLQPGGRSCSCRLHQLQAAEAHARGWPGSRWLDSRRRGARPLVGARSGAAPFHSKNHVPVHTDPFRSQIGKGVCCRGQAPMQC